MIEQDFHIVVCLKQILDPEIPTRDFRVDRIAREAERGGASLVTNIFCENALETALQFKEKHGSRVTVLAFGRESVEDSLRKALAMKADNALMVTYDEQRQLDPNFVSSVLAKAITKLGKVDLILVGRESGDWGHGMTGGLLAEILELPCISFVDEIEVVSDRLRIRRQTGTGVEFFSAVAPLVLTITNNDHNVPRIPKTRDVMMSYRQPLTKFTLGELGMNGEGESYFETVDLRLPHRGTDCEFVKGETLEERVDVFARRILRASASA